MVKDDSVVVGSLADKRAESFIATGTDLDGLIGGGIPRGRITELWGKEGVGKTHIATLLMANMSQSAKVLYVDTEFSLNKERVIQLGANPKNIKYVADSRLEKVCELLVESVDQYDLIILDSLAFLTPMTVANAEIGERSIGLFALLLKHWVLKFRPKLGNSKTALLVLNQYRPSIGMYAVPEPPGGKAYHHACDIRIYLSTTATDRIMDGKTRVGHYVKCETKKNKLAAPFTTCKIKLMYNSLDNEA